MLWHIPYLNILSIILMFAFVPTSSAQHVPLEAGVWGIEWSPDGALLASANPEGRIFIYDTDQNLVRTLPGHSRRAIAVSWSPDGTKLATGGWDNYVRIWEVSTGDLLQELTVYFGAHIVDWQPTREYLLTATSDTLQAWNTVTWEPITFGAGITLLDIEWNVGGTQFAMTYTGGIATASIEDGSFKYFEYVRDVAANSITWSSDSTRLLTAGGLDGTITLWDVATMEQVRIILQADVPIWDAVFMDESAITIAAVSANGSIYLAHVADGEIVNTFTQPNAQLWAVAWNPELALLAFSGHIENQSRESGETTSVLEMIMLADFQR
ncbi:MAG: hypothetical protein KA401_02290 [Anaerolineae bacterium]|nr:hypothetical protein [Anaerolineae bacterium]